MSVQRIEDGNKIAASFLPTAPPAPAPTQATPFAGPIIPSSLSTAPLVDPTKIGSFVSANVLDTPFITTGTAVNTPAALAIPAGTWVVSCKIVVKSNAASNITRCIAITNGLANDRSNNSGISINNSIKNYSIDLLPQVIFNAGPGTLNYGFSIVSDFPVPVNPPTFDYYILAYRIA